MQDLPPIPSAPGHLWREFRLKLAPFLVFFSVLALTVHTWRGYVGPRTFVGEVEQNQVQVISTLPGILAELNVDLFQAVKKGQVLGRIFSADPQQLKASLAAVEADLKVLRARMALDERRNDLSVEQLRLDLLTHRAELAMARADLQQAEAQLERIRQLHAQKVAAEMELDVAIRDRDRLLHEVEQKTVMISAVEASLARLGESGHKDTAQPEVDLIQQAIAAQERSLTFLEGPIDLIAPVDGTVSSLTNRPGQKLMAGTPILTITPAAERIVGYILQPVRFIPKPGDRVQIRTRGPQRQVGSATVQEIGGDMQPVAAPMTLRGFENGLERGLPFLVSIPPGMKLIPGELVDVVVSN